MPFILHHTEVKGHSVVPYLFRASCTCGWFALAPTEARAQAACSNHLDEQEPFDLDKYIRNLPPEAKQ